jgi:hypothetical protein
MAGDRWVLAYSERCSSCTRVADGIAELAGGRLEIRGLLEPDVVEWREATGHANDWQPILFVLSDGGPKAYVGRALAWKLARRLGLRRASQAARLVAGLEDSTAIAESVRSRRQFIKKAALGAASLAGIGILGRLPVAAASSSAKPQSSTLLTQRVLQPNDDVLTAAFASKEVSTVVAKHGRSSFGEFTHATYTNNVEAVTAALQPSVGPARMVFAYFRNQQPTEFKVLQLEVVPDLGTNPAQSFSGSARFLAHDESVITSAVFHNGALVSSTFGGGSTYAGGGAVPYAEDWNCVHYCIHNLWWMLPWWVTWACGNVCGACMFINPWGCYLCTGCLGGYAARCLVDCWY